MNRITLSRFRLSLLIALLSTAYLLSCSNPGSTAQTTDARIQVSFPTDYEEKTLDGRLIVLISKEVETEPRFQLRDDAKTCQGFGMDVTDWKPEEALPFEMDAFGYPVRSFADLPSGEFFVQVLFHKYETFNRADGHIVKLPMDRGEGQKWNRAPGNLYSTPQKVSIQNGQLPSLTVQLDQQIPPIAEPEDTKYIKHIKIKSKLLSDFWGRDMYLGAHVLLPEGWDTHPNVKYPLAIMHGHFPNDFGG
ncbi:MAG: hypothetical protein AAFV78_20105, partial [Bacteroidota bacterium]